MTDRTLFAASYAKLDRARQFIDELSAAQEAYRADEPFKIRIERTEASHAGFLDFKLVGLLPGAIVGDAVHNLRAALDLMASELARLQGNSDKNVYFPFSESEQTLADAIKNRGFHKTGADSVDLLRRFKPYRNGNTMLRGLHDLDIQDKHTALVALATTSSLQISGRVNIENPTNHSLSILRQSVDFVFPTGSAFEGQGMVQTLEEAVEVVHRVVMEFASLVELRSAADNPVS